MTRTPASAARAVRLGHCAGTLLSPALAAAAATETAAALWPALHLTLGLAQWALIAAGLITYATVGRAHATGGPCRRCTRRPAAGTRWHRFAGTLVQALLRSIARVHQRTRIPVNLWTVTAATGASALALIAVLTWIVPGFEFAIVLALLGATITALRSNDPAAAVPEDASDAMATGRL